MSASSVPRHKYQLNAVKFVKRGGRIIGGVDSRIEDFPYMIGLFFNRRHTCGGSILNENTVISAAHCTYGRNHNNFQILAGSSSISQGELVAVSRVVEHPNYDDFELFNDVVVLKLEVNLVFSDRIRPLPLPSIGFQVAPGRPTILAGWGALEWNTNRFPDIIQSVTKPALSNEECQRIYENEIILDSHVCSGENGKDACQGDSGGPLVYSGIHLGIVSWGYECGTEWPTVYARVSSFLGFILSNA